MQICLGGFLLKVLYSRYGQLVRVALLSKREAKDKRESSPVKERGKVTKMPTS